MGIAKYQGADIDLDSPFINYLPQYSNINNYSQVQNITLHNLLSQRHGYDWDEWTISYGEQLNPITQMLNTADWYLTALQWPIALPPGQRFAYSTGHSSLMSPILQNRTGRDVYEFAQVELFDPIDISDTHWELYLGEGGLGQGISVFPHGLEPLGFGLWLKPIDMAKIGEMYRLGGVWQGERILSQEWIDQAITRYSDGITDSQVFSSE